MPRQALPDGYTLLLGTDATFPDGLALAAVSGARQGFSLLFDP